MIKQVALARVCFANGQNSSSLDGLQTGSGQTRRRENVVGVNMVLAQVVRFKHGLYKSCGVECFEGMMLEPRLLQPGFHVAGKQGRRRGATIPHSELSWGNVATYGNTCQDMGKCGNMCARKVTYGKMSGIRGPSLRTHTLQLEITIVRFPPRKVLYPGVKSTQNGPSWAISDFCL